MSRQRTQKYSTIALLLLLLLGFVPTAINAEEAPFYAYSLNNGSEYQVFLTDRSEPVGTGTEPRFSSDGKYLFWITQNGNLGYIQIDGGVAYERTFALSTVESIGAGPNNMFAFTLLTGNTTSIWKGEMVKIQETDQVYFPSIVGIDTEYQGQENAFFGKDGVFCFDAHRTDVFTRSLRAVYCLDQDGSRVRISPDTYLDYGAGTWDSNNDGRYILVENNSDDYQLTDEAGTHLLPNSESSTLPNCTPSGCVYQGGSSGAWKLYNLADGTVIGNGQTGDYKGVTKRHIPPPPLYLPILQQQLA